MPDFKSVPCRRYLLPWVFLASLLISAAPIQTALGQTSLKAERNGLCKSLFPEDCASTSKSALEESPFSGARLENSTLRRQERTRARVVRRIQGRLNAGAAQKMASNPAVAANEQDSLALVALYDNLDGPAWFNQAGWLAENVSNWAGVTINQDGRVVGLTLSSNNLFGDLPADISMLSELTELNLSDNFLIGELPAEIGQLQNLQVLNLSFNFIGGSIPDSYQNLSNLVELIVWGNGLVGEIPVGLTTLTGLKVFSLDFNQLTGPIPPQLGLLTELEELYVDNNLLSGDIPPELGNLSNLQSVFLGNNSLQGTFPTELTTIEGLRTLSIENAGLTGEIPPEIANLRQMVTLDLSLNFFEGSFPSGLQSLSSLGTLYLNDNLFTGQLPAEFGFQLFNLVELDLAGNFFEGQLPASIGQLQVLNYLDLSFNQFTGAIPDMNPNQRLRFLYLNNNEFEGTINTQLFQLFSLFELDLAWNNLTGELPGSIANNVFMQDLRFAQNNFVGPIPGIYTSMDDLIVLDLWENDLTGPIPEGIGELEELFLFDVGGNALSGEIPPALGELPSIAGIFMDNNDFGGALPESFAANDSLFILLVNDNALTFIPNLTENQLLDSLAISNNHLTFDSIEQNAKAAGGNVSYAPQRPIPVTVDELDTGIRFTTEVAGSANSYQWFIGDASLNGAMAPVYEAPFASLVSEEVVVLEVTNSIVTDLVLESEPIRADARLSRVDITPADIMLLPGDSVQLVYSGFDQFDNERRFTGIWSASGGSVSETGLYIAGDTPGTFEVTVSGLNGVPAGSVQITIEDPNVVSVEEPTGKQLITRLHTNYPNPFSGSTELQVELGRATHVSLKVF